jgi:hypothetical protein
MKRILILILTAIICLSAFSGCAESPDDPVDLEVTFSDNLTSFPKDPPVLFVRKGETRIKAWRGTCSWMVEGEDGLGRGVESDSPHPLDCKDSLPVIDVGWLTTLTLSFEGHPIKITVKQYALNATGYDDYEEIKVKESAVKAKSGCIYEVIATWSGEKYSGTVYYAFRTK